MSGCDLKVVFCIIGILIIVGTGHSRFQSSIITLNDIKKLSDSTMFIWKLVGYILGILVYQDEGISLLVNTPLHGNVSMYFL